MSDKKIQLYQKMLAVMEAIDYLQKDDHVKYGQQDYKAISEEKVTTTVRAELIKNKLIVFPVEQEHTREGTLSTVNVKYKIVDVETGEYEILVSSGTGADTQDKGVGKAMTYAFKYLFLRTFAIPTGEDPDKISSAELDDKIKKQQISEEEKELERQTKINHVLAKWQTLSGEKDGKKATESLETFLQEKWKKTLQTVSIQDLTMIEKTLAKRLLEKAQENKKGA